MTEPGSVMRRGAAPPGTHLHATPALDLLLDPGALPERLGTGMTWTEGPVWLPDHDAVIFSEIPSNRIMRWVARSGLTLHRTDVEFTNGRTLDRDGTIIACSHGRRAVEGSTRTAAPRSSSIGTGRTG